MMMMRIGIPLGACAVMLLVSSTPAAEPFKSGLQPGQRVSVFHPLNVTGANAGEKACQV
jgi:hypothetical protein